MATIENLANPISLMPLKDLHAHILEIRRQRRIIKKPVKKATVKNTKTKLDLKTIMEMMSEEERDKFIEEIGG